MKIVFAIAVPFSLGLVLLLRKFLIHTDTAYRSARFMVVIRKGAINAQLSYPDAKQLAALWSLDDNEVRASLIKLKTESLAHPERFGEPGQACALSLLARHEEVTALAAQAQGLKTAQEPISASC